MDDGVAELKMQRFICLVSALFALTGCSDVTPEVHSRLSVQLPSTDIDAVRVWAEQNGEEVEALRITDIDHELDLLPDVETQIFATIFQIELNGSSGSAGMDATRLIEKWIAWNGETEMFLPPAGPSSQSVTLSTEGLSIVFSAFMSDEAEVKHTWEGDWPGLNVDDAKLYHRTSYSLAKNVSVPPSRDIFVTPLHPLGELLAGYEANTDDWQADPGIDLGNAPLPFPVSKVTTVDAGTQLANIVWQSLYDENEADIDYAFECNISDTPGDGPDCNVEAGWTDCNTLPLDADDWTSVRVDVRYANLPTINCGRVIVTRERTGLSPCDTIDCEDGLVCVGDGVCVAEPNINITMAWDETERDNQYLVVGNGGFERVTFRVEADSQEIAALSTPQLIALAPSADGSISGSPITGSSCIWDTTESGFQLYIICEGFGGSTDVFENSMAALSIEYHLGANEDAVFAARQKFRVLGLPETTNKPVFLRALPAYGRVSKESDFVQLWVQVGYYSSITVQMVGTPIRLEASIREISSEASIVDLDPSMILNPIWTLPANGTGSEWYLVQMNRDEYAGLFPDSGFLTLTLEQLGSDEVGNESDEVSGNFKFIDSTPTFISSADGLRLPSDDLVLGESPVLEFPMRGLGPNRGGYVVHIGDPAGVGMSSDDPTLDPPISLELTVNGEHQFHVMSKTRRDLGLAGTSTSSQSLVEVDSVQPTQPVSLAFNRLFVDHATTASATQYEVRHVDLGFLKRLLWDPQEQELIVVGKQGIEFVRTDSTDPGLASGGVVELNNVNFFPVPAAGTSCSGEIVDAVLFFTLDADNTWQSNVAALVLPAVEGAIVQHCIHSRESNTFSQLSLSNVAGPPNNNCGSALYSSNLAFAYNPLNKTYWVLSDQCLLGYQTLDSQGNFDTNLIASLPTGTSSELGSPIPSNLAIEPHSGVAIAQYFLDGRTSYKRFVLGSDPSTSPSSGQTVTSRTGMVYDTVRGWTWEVAGVYSGNNSAAWYWMPSVGDLSSDSGGHDFVNGGGITHAVMDASRDVIYSLKLEHRPEDGFVVTQEINDIANDASNISLRAAGSEIYRSQDSPLDTDADNLTDLDELVLGTDATLANQDWNLLTLPGAKQPIIDVILMGPQVIAGLPAEIAAGDILTIQGTGFTGDTSRDQVCVQATCVAPISSTPTAMTFRVPALFSQLDYPLRAFVTVSDGHRMSGPVPGDCKLVPLFSTWRSHLSSIHFFSCGESGGDCEGGGFIHGAPDTYLSMYQSNSTPTAYRLEPNSGQPVQIDSGNLQVSLGASSVSPYGSGITLGLGRNEANAEIFYEVRGTTRMSMMPSLPAQIIFGDALAQSRANSAFSPLRFNNQNLDDSYESDKVIITSDLAKVGLGNRLDAAGSSLGWAGFSRHINQPQVATGNFPAADALEAMVPLPGLGGYATADTSGAIIINIVDHAGNTNSFSTNTLCDWETTDSFKLYGATSQYMVMGVAVLEQAPLRLGVIKLYKAPEGSTWEAHCATRVIEGSNANGSSLRAATAGNGAYLALGLENGGLFQIYVWETYGSRLKLIYTNELDYLGLGLEFSHSGKELYVLGYNNLAVVHFEKTPVEN